MERISKKTIILVVTLLLVLLVFGLIFAFTNKANPSVNESQQQYTENDRGMPWNIVVDFVGKGLVEKIEVIDPSTIRVFLKDESTAFIVNQPTQDAYIEIISTSPGPINIIK